MFKRMRGGGRVKGFLNNVQKKCTFLSWRLPLLFFVLITITIVDCFLWMPSDHIMNLSPVRSGRRWQLSCCQPLGICHFYSRSNTNFSNNKKSRRDKFVNVKDKTRMIRHTIWDLESFLPHFNKKLYILSEISPNFMENRIKGGNILRMNVAPMFIHSF